jgi:hypothetical protein
VTETDRALPFFTIGHSTRRVVELADLLTAVEVGVLVDVRAVPRSRTNPQFNKDVLPAALVSSAIDYEHIAALGGLRGRKTGILPALNAFWTNQSFHNYADIYLETNQLGRLIRLRLLCPSGEEPRPRNELGSTSSIFGGARVPRSARSRTWLPC